MNAWKERRLEHLPSVLILIKAEKHKGKRFWVIEKCFEREKNKWNPICTLTLNGNCSSMDWDIYWALNLDRNESVEVLSRICRRQKYLDGSRSCWESIGKIESYLMDQRSCRASIEKKSRNLDGLRLR